MPLSKDELERIAELARLELDPGEADLLAEQVGSILEHMARLARADPGEGEAPGGPASGPAPLRPDRVAFEPLRRPPEAFAPAFRDGLFLVPRLPALRDEAAQPESGSTG